nr:unnamed protein product [Spirometra erinaceieuropaei]
MATRVVNLSKRSLSHAEITLLSKGIGFNHTDATSTDFLAELESTLLASNLPEDMRTNIRNCATVILQQKRYQQNLPAEEAQGLRSLKSDYSIVVVPADKGCATVITYRIEYVNKANEIFSDIEAYTFLAEDPTKKQATAIKKVNELARLKVIRSDDSKLMTLSDLHIAHAYGLPKVHKVDVPLRIMLPLIGSPIYDIAKWLYSRLNRLTHGSDYNINNSSVPPQDTRPLSRCLGIRINEHKLAIRRRDPLSLAFARAREYDRRFTWDGTEVVAMANTKRVREFLETGYSNVGSINRHVHLDIHYAGLRSRLTAPCLNHASTIANAAARIPTDSPPTLRLQHSVPWLFCLLPLPPSLRDQP